MAALESASSKSLLGRKVLRMQCHVGYGDTAKTGAHYERDNAQMVVTPAGIYLKQPKGEFLVPYSNVTWCQLEKEDGNK